MGILEGKEDIIRSSVCTSFWRGLKKCKSKLDERRRGVCALIDKALPQSFATALSLRHSANATPDFRVLATWRLSRPTISVWEETDTPVRRIGMSRQVS